MMEDALLWCTIVFAILICIITYKCSNAICIFKMILYTQNLLPRGELTW